MIISSETSTNSCVVVNGQIIIILIGRKVIIIVNYVDHEARNHVCRGGVRGEGRSWPLLICSGYLKLVGTVRERETYHRAPPPPPPPPAAAPLHTYFRIDVMIVKINRRHKCYVPLSEYLFYLHNRYFILVFIYFCMIVFSFFIYFFNQASDSDISILILFYFFILLFTVLSLILGMSTCENVPIWTHI